MQVLMKSQRNEDGITQKGQDLNQYIFMFLYYLLWSFYLSIDSNEFVVFISQLNGLENLVQNYLYLSILILIFINIFLNITKNCSFTIKKNYQKLYIATPDTFLLPHKIIIIFHRSHYFEITF